MRERQGYVSRIRKCGRILQGSVLGASALLPGAAAINTEASGSAIAEREAESNMVNVAN
jgi:hypothetical protein